MPASERIARLLVVPLAVLFVVLLLRGSGGSDPDPVTAATDVGAGAPSTTAAAPSTTPRSADAPSTSSSVPSSSTTTSAPTTSTSAPTTTSTTTGDGPDADELLGTYRDGAVVLRGTVADQATADAYRRRLAAALGNERVTSELALDRRSAERALRIVVDRSFASPQGGDLDPGFASLAALADTLLDGLPEATLVITGHTDAVGTEATDRALSVARARLALDHLVELGVPADRTSAAGAGHSEPVGPNDTPAGRAANRRITAAFEGITADGR